MKPERKPGYPELFLTFAWVGLCMFGGGYAMLPVLQRELVRRKKWCGEDDLTDCYAISQCTPGPIAVNTATALGYKQRGVFGGILATLGVVFPSVVIISIIAAFLQSFAHLSIVSHAFGGIRAAVVALIASSVLDIGKRTLSRPSAVAVYAAVLLLAVLAGLSPVLLVVLAGLYGLAFSLWAGRAEK